MLKTKKTGVQKSGKKLQETAQEAWKWRMEIEMRRMGIGRQGSIGREMLEGEDGPIGDGHVQFYCLDMVTTTGREDSAGAGKKSWSAETKLAS